ncbi:hypothetical protein EJB05_30353, partial [Eragrostis curvula]
MGRNKRRRQQQQPKSGRPVLLTFYVARPARDGGAAATASAHGGGVRSHHQRHEACRGKKQPKVVHNRRAELLEYSRQLRALARQTTAATRPPPSPPRPRCRDTTKAGVAPADAGRPAAENRLTLAGRRHERSKSQQKIKQRCFGNGGWSWKRVLVLVFPFHSGSHSDVGRSKSKRPRRGHDEARESNRNTNQKGSPATLMVGNGKLTVSRASRDHNGLRKKLMSIFRQRL